MLSSFCNTEVTQLICTVRRHKDILRLDVSVQDTSHLAIGKRTAYIFSDRDDQLVGHSFRKRFCQWGQQLHFNKDVPAYAVVMLDIFHIIAVDDIGAALHIRHQRILPDNILQETFKTLGDAFLIIAVTDEFVDIASTLGNGDHFQRGLLLVPEHIPLDFIHSPKAAPPDQPHCLPARP